MVTVRTGALLAAELGESHAAMTAVMRVVLDGTGALSERDIRRVLEVFRPEHFDGEEWRICSILLMGPLMFAVHERGDDDEPAGFTGIGSEYEGPDF